MKQFDSIICIAQTPWDGDFQKAAVQLMTELSARHRVLFVDYLYTLKDLVQGMTGRQDVPVRKIMHLSDPLINKTTEQTEGELYVWTPPTMLPINWLSAKRHDRFLPWNTDRLISNLLGIMDQLGMHHPLIINAYNPVIGLPLLGKLNECATIYYCFDEITTAGDWMNRHGKRYEDAFIQRVDAVVTTSETLRQDKSGLQPQTFCVKNGANFELFSQARQLAQHSPEKQIVGYLGSADNRINIDIMEHCTQTMPDVDFQFIGEVHEPELLRRLSTFPNVTFIPPHQPADLPPLLAKLSVGIIPFICNRHTYTIYPLKINEYLAAGLPVVSTPFSILDDFEGIIELADTPDRFAQALRRAMADTDDQRVQQRVDMAHNNSWERRACEFEAVIQQVPKAWQPEQSAQLTNVDLPNQ